MLMGPTGSPGTYQVAVERTLGDLLDPGPCSSWMDDIFTSGDDFEIVLATVILLLRRCRRDGLKLSPNKTSLFVPEETIGGVKVSKDGVLADPGKVQALVKWPRPTTAKEVLSFVNTANMFRSSIEDFAGMAAPLYDLTHHLDVGTGKGAKKRALNATDITGRWLREHDIAFARLKTCLTTFPVVNGPVYDGRPFHISCDASNKGFGAHLYHLDRGAARTIAYASKQASEVDSRKHSSEPELMAVKWALDYFHKFVYGQRIVLHTDCQAVKDLLRGEVNSTGYRMAWKEAILGSRIIEFVHTKGVENVVADGLSRQPGLSGDPVVPDWEDYKGCSNAYAGLKMITSTVDDQVLLRYKHDAHEDIVRVLLAMDTEKIPEDQLWNAQQRSKPYWIAEGYLMKGIEGHGEIKVLPASEGAKAASAEHVDGGHLGRDFMLSSLAQRYYWTSMRADVEASIKTCRRCCLFGNRHQKYLLKPIIQHAPFDMMVMDFVSMPVGTNGHNEMLVSCDVFTRYIHAESYKGPPTSNMVIRFLDSYINRFVRMRRLLLDNGSQFQCNAMAEWAERNKVVLEYSTPYAHVGLAESANHLVLERLRRLCNLDVDHIPVLSSPTTPKHWPKELDSAVARLHERKLPYMGGFSPKDILFGPGIGQHRNEGLPVSVRLCLLDNMRTDAEVAFTEEQMKRLQRCKTWNLYEPEINDLVLVWDALGDRLFDTLYKLRARWQGPLRVIEVGKRSVVVERLDGVRKKGAVSWAMVKKWVVDE